MGAGLSYRIGTCPEYSELKEMKLMGAGAKEGGKRTKIGMAEEEEGVTDLSFNCAIGGFGGVARSVSFSRWA